MSAVAHRRLALLALVAMLLLALLPTAGRLVGRAVACEEGGATQHAMSHDSAMAEAMAHMTPEEHHAHMALMARMGSHHGVPSPKPAAHDGHDCPYCPLLSGLAGGGVLSWSPAVPVALAPWSVRAVVHRPVDAPVPALGAQGPPQRSTA
ncbi:hypothetical protein [Lysobacter sp. HA35]